MRAAGAALRARAHRPARRRRSTAATSSRATCGRKLGRAGPARHHRAGALGRRRPRLPRAHRRHGGDLARLGRGRPLLRRALEPVREPAAPERQRRAARRATCRSSSAASTSARWRCPSRAPARTSSSMQLRAEQRGDGYAAQRPQDVDHQRPGRRRARRLRQDRRRPPARAASPPSSSRRATPASRTAQKLDKLGMRGSSTCELVFEECLRAGRERARRR